MEANKFIDRRNFQKVIYKERVICKEHFSEWIVLKS